MSNATAVEASPKKATLRSGMHVKRVSRDFLDKLLADLNEKQWTAQPFPGAGHILFQVGHLAVTDGFFVSAIGGSTSAIPESWNALFGMGAEPKSDAGAYPKPAQVKAALHQARGDLIARFESLSEADLAKPVGEPLTSVADCVAGLPAFICMHDGMHTGQILALRRSLGLPRVMG